MCSNDDSVVTEDNSENILEHLDWSEENLMNYGSNEPRNIISNCNSTTNSDFPIIYQRKTIENRSHARHPFQNKRILEKSGRTNVFFSKIPNKHIRYVKDLGNTLINTRWRWILLSLCVANAIAWIFFAFMWMAIAVLNDDFNKNDQLACIVGTRHFSGYLLLSIETLTTIGFGVIYPGDCKEGWIVLTLQALTGVAIEGALVTAVYVKMSRPFTKHANGLFSKKAVICLRDGNFCLIFRIGDLAGKYWAKTQIKAYLIQKRFSFEGEILPNYIQKLKLDYYGLLVWPVDVVHVVNEDSPMWDYSAMNLMNERFEIMVVIQGDSITTGQSSQSQTSYVSAELEWGSRFRCCINFDEDKQKYIIDNKKINATFMYDTPLCSASRYRELLNELSI